MKSDLDRLMAERNIDALIIFPSENEDPYRAYLSNGAHYSGAVVKKQGEPPVLISNAMEIDEAAKSGLKVFSYEDFRLSDLMREHNTDAAGVSGPWYRTIFETLGIRGKVAVFGVSDVNSAFRNILSIQHELGDQIEFITEPPRHTIFDAAYETKDAAEIARLRAVAERTSAVMRSTREWIATHRAEGETVVQDDGSPLTIGDVKRYVRMRLFEQGLEDPEGMIFAQGRDAAVPHSKGEESQALKLGSTIVFDLFPREPGGYFHDMTRTWCIGYAPPEVQQAYNTVMEAFERSIEMCKVGLTTKHVQVMVCELFEASGHPTVLSTPGTAQGYVHTLAHGVGLNIHEAPFFPTFLETYKLQTGNVFTIEPGLYYPDRGYGVRIEDTVHLNERGEMESLTDCPYDLVIELKG